MVKKVTVAMSKLSANKAKKQKACGKAKLKEIQSFDNIEPKHQIVKKRFLGHRRIFGDEIFRIEKTKKIGATKMALVITSKGDFFIPVLFLDLV
jgi:hypothetical protein